MQAAVPHQARFGPYLILRKLGEGAMAKVYLARRADERGMQEEVALKVLRREYSGKPEILSLLRREAVIGGKMRHPHVIATVEFGEIDGLPYLAMEYVQGVTVADLLEMVEDQGRGLPPELTASLMIQVCDGLSYAHNLQGKDGPLGVVHRDLKPGNVMVSLSGVAKVMDFGVAKIKMYGGDITTIHRTTRGTPAYMSPEQARGDHLTHHSDIFTAGLLLYELITGRKPFTGENFNELLRKVREGELTTQAEEVEVAAPGMGRIFRRAIAAAPLRRYPDALWMKEDLEQLFPVDTPIPPPSLEEGAFDTGPEPAVAPGVVPPPPLALPAETQPSAIAPEDTLDGPEDPDDGPQDEVTVRSRRVHVPPGGPVPPGAVNVPPREKPRPAYRAEAKGDDDTRYYVIDEQAPADDLSPTDDLPPPPLPDGEMKGDDPTRYYALETAGPPSAGPRSASPVENDDDIPTEIDHTRTTPDPATQGSTRYYAIPEEGTDRTDRPDRLGPDDDEPEYYEIEEAAPDIPAIPTVNAASTIEAPRLLGEPEAIGDDEEIELDPETFNELDAMEEDDISAIDLETLPELDLDDETIPEVDLGPPVFLELRPKPDPDVPVSTDTLVHLTQFLVELYD